MPVYNYQIGEVLRKLADLSEISGENPFKIRAYRKAIQTVTHSSVSIAGMVMKGEDISQLTGIGKSIAKKIKEYVEDGHIQKLDELEQNLPSELTEMMKMSQLGPERVKALYQDLNITGIDELEEAAQNNRIKDLSGFGEKIQANILEEIKRYKQEGTQKKRLKWVFAEEIVQSYIAYLRKHEDVVKVEPAGSYRRKKETIGDVDILTVCRNPEQVMEHFVAYEEVRNLQSQGSTKSSVILHSGLQVDLRAVPEESYGAALMYFTGSKDHNVALRGLANQFAWKLNEYGIYTSDKRMAGSTEEEMYETLGLAYIPPELREDRGEVEAAQANQLPELLTWNDISGDLQTHTTASDGTHTLNEMVKAAKKLGYTYYAVTDHSKRVAVANGLNEKRLREQIEEIDRFNEQVEGIKVLKSIEVDILQDGRLDLPNEVLKELDMVICSVHFHTNLSEEKQTERIIRAMDNPFFNILAHPTGRMIGERSPYPINMERVLEAAKDKGCYPEINAAPQRLDLNEYYAKLAKDIGVKLSISTDAHSVDNLYNMRYGVYQARRGWLEKEDVLNARPWDQLQKLLRR